MQRDLRRYGRRADSALTGTSTRGLCVLSLWSTIVLAVGASLLTAADTANAPLFLLVACMAVITTTLFISYRKSRQRRTTRR